MTALVDGAAVTGLTVAWPHLTVATVTRLYRPRTAETDPRPRDTHLDVAIPAVAAAYRRHLHLRQPWLFGWTRTDAGGPITIVTSSTTSPVDADTGGSGLTYPPAAAGHHLPGEALHRLLTATGSWRRIAAVHDILTVAPDHEPQIPTGLQDTLLDPWPYPFAWILLAEPLTSAEIAEHIAVAADVERDARSRANSPQYQLAAERAAHRHRELRAGESTGLWRMHLCAGATDAAASDAFAGLLCAALGATGISYTLTPTTTVGDLDTCLAATASATSGGVTSPSVTGGGVIAGIARPPTAEIPGIRLTNRPTFDVTPETTSTELTLGTILDHNARTGGRLGLSRDSLVRHLFVTGATGSGKTRTVQHLLAQASTAGIPWLVIEPAKAEYRRQLTGSDVIVLRPGDPDVPALGFNPLEPAPGFPLQTHADLVRALFTAAFQAQEPFPQILAAALTRAYQRNGWNLALSEPTNPGIQPRWPTLSDLQIAAEDIIAAAGYGPEVDANVRGFIAVRLGSLRLGTPGHFFQATRHLDFDDLLTHNVILEIEDVGDDLDKAFFIGATLLRLTEHLRTRHHHTGGDRHRRRVLRHLTVVEEAHRLLRHTDGTGPATHAVETFANLLAEVRAYDEGIIIVDQIPAKLIPDVIKNTAVKIVHRLPARDDRDIVGATMGLTDDQSEHLISVPPGIAAVHTDGMDRPLLVRIPPPHPVTRNPSGTPANPRASMPATCDTDCLRTCTLRSESHAQQLLTQHPAIELWCELAVLAHLVAISVPPPGGRLSATMTSVEPRALTCALRRGAGNAIASRITAISTTHNPDALHAHVLADLHRQVTDHNPCPDPATAWCAPGFQWNPARIALAMLLRTNPDSPAHPDTDRWPQLHGITVPGDSAREQLDYVLDQARHAEQSSTYPTLIFGRRPADIHNPVHDTDLTTLLTEFDLDLDWPHAYLLTAVG